jgi:tRNA A37 threonylcarbamoyladenosine dehydratase
MAFGDRNRILFGEDGYALLAHAHVCVFGLGGVGAAAAMDLVRAGVGSITAVDFDLVQESNLNRLYFGSLANIGQPKVEAFAQAARLVNPAIELDLRGAIVRGAHAASFIPEGCGFYLDCIDSLNPKVNLIAALLKAELPFAASMGTAGRMAPERLRLGSLWESSGCPLAQHMRQRLGRLGFRRPLSREEKRASYMAHAQGQERPYKGRPVDISCVWSDEPPVAPAAPPDGHKPGDTVNGERVRVVQGSGPFVPQAAGHLLASYAVRRLLGGGRRI